MGDCLIRENSDQYDRDGAILERPACQTFLAIERL
jgi:hypothetical protein